MPDVYIPIAEGDRVMPEVVTGTGEAQPFIIESVIGASECLMEASDGETRTVEAERVIVEGVMGMAEGDLHGYPLQLQLSEWQLRAWVSS